METHNVWENARKEFQDGARVVSVAVRSKRPALLRLTAHALRCCRRPCERSVTLRDDADRCCAAC